MPNRSLRRMYTYGVATVVGLTMTAAPAQAILGGSDTPRPESWMVSLQNDKDHYCGGTLVAPGWVLTAAHCVVDLPGKPLRKPDKVVIGSLSKSHGGVTARASDVHPHPTAKLVESNGSIHFEGTDLALIKLDRPVPTRPAPLSRKTPPVGTDTRLLGWGYAGDDANGEPVFPDRLQEVTLPLAETDKDRLRFKDSAGRGAGAGDSGGPAVVKSGHGWTLVGVTSSGGKDSAGVTHSSYTDVSVHQLWIYRTMTGHQP